MDEMCCFQTIRCSCEEKYAQETLICAGQTFSRTVILPLIGLEESSRNGRDAKAREVRPINKL